MLFVRRRKSLDPFYDEYAEVYYVDGTYVTSVVAFLIFAAVAIPALALFGVVKWLCDHMMLLYVLYAVGVVILIIMQSRHTRKKYMFFYALSTLTMLVIPITATIAYIFPIMVFGETLSAALSVIFSSLLFYGGAFMTFSINRIIKNGIACFFVSLIYLAVALLILYGFISVDAEAMKNLISILSISYGHKDDRTKQRTARFSCCPFCFYIYQYLFYLSVAMILAISTVRILSVIPPDIT